MSTAVARITEESVVARPADKLADVQRLGSILNASGYFSDIRDMAQAAVKIMAGEELGISPVAAVMGIHIIKGKVTLSANLIAAQVRRHGYNYKHLRFDNQGCVLQFISKSGEVLGESSFTEEDAKTAGVYGDMYRKFPRNMYYSRAMSNGAKWYCPEVTSGLPVYLPEELGATVNAEGEFVEEPSPEKESKRSRAEKAQAAQDIGIAKVKAMKEGANYRDLGVGPQDTAIIEAAQGPTETEALLEASVDRAQKLSAEKIRLLEAFADVKKSLISLTDKERGESEYYQILGKHGFEKSSHITDMAIGRSIYREMAKRVTDLKAEQV